MSSTRSGQGDLPDPRAPSAAGGVRTVLQPADGKPHPHTAHHASRLPQVQNSKRAPTQLPFMLSLKRPCRVNTGVSDISSYCTSRRVSCITTRSHYSEPACIMSEPWTLNGTVP